MLQERYAPRTQTLTHNPSCYLPPGPEKIVAAMLWHTIAAFCIIDDAIQAMGHKDDPQAKTPASAILTLAIPEVLERVLKALKRTLKEQELKELQEVQTAEK